MPAVLDRSELERLDRDTLVSRAEEAGVSRATILTRPELIDELLLRASPVQDDPTVARARGFFGRARDLLARVIEKGLHLPDAAERVRRISMPPPSRRSSPAAVPTVTLAEIYAAQGHKGRAIETLRRVLQHEPEHAAARALLARLDGELQSSGSLPHDVDLAGRVGDAGEGDGEGLASSGIEEEGDAGGGRRGGGRAGAGTGAGAGAGAGAGGGAGAEEAVERVLAEPAEPSGFLDDTTLPERYDVDECVAISVDPKTLFTYWEIRPATLAHLRRTRPEGHVMLRVLIVTPSWEGPRSETRDIDVVEPLGDWFIRDLPPAAVVRAAIGWRTGDAFLPVAHSQAIETPADAPSRMLADVFIRWSPAQPSVIVHRTTSGWVEGPEPRPSRPEVPKVWQRRGRAGAPGAGGKRGGEFEPLGSSEVWRR